MDICQPEHAEKESGPTDSLIVNGEIVRGHEKMEEETNNYYVKKNEMICEELLQKKTYRVTL